MTSWWQTGDMTLALTSNRSSCRYRGLRNHEIIEIELDLTLMQERDEISGCFEGQTVSAGRSCEMRSSIRLQR